MTRQTLILLAAGGSAALLLGAFYYQLNGYPPCQMCIWQRWPHAAAVGIGALAFLMPLAIWPWLGALAAAATAGIGVYHTGVERDWWDGPASCAGSVGNLGGDLLSLDGPPLVMCDIPSWIWLGLSMASWNALASAGLAVIWLTAAWTTTGSSRSA